MKVRRKFKSSSTKPVRPNSLILGDCMAIMKNIPSASVDMILCDLPREDKGDVILRTLPLELLWKEYKRILTLKGVIVLPSSQPCATTLINSNLKMFKYEWIWHKSMAGSAFVAKYRPVNKHENILVFGHANNTYNPIMEEGDPYTVKRKANIGKAHKGDIVLREDFVAKNEGTRFPTTVQLFRTDWRRQDQLHPNQKPVSMMEYFIKTYTNKGGVVLDSCMGSGTTGVASKNTGRKFIGIENDSKYFEVAVTRITEGTV
jgi:site-specific DNA-methyltransferase (adenine-specific)